MKYRVEIQPNAADEIAAAYGWIRDRSPNGAIRWRDGLRVALESLEQNPQRCPLAPEDDAFDEEIRQLLYGKRGGVYRILFTITRNTVSVLHVRHAARRFLNE